MNPHYYSQTESSLQKTMPPAKLKEKLESLTDDVERIKDELENHSRSLFTLEKHNGLVLRQFDQLRGIFEKFYEEIIQKIGNVQKDLDDRITQNEINTQPKLLKLEKLAEIQNSFRDQTTSSLHELQQYF
jgi:ABC-type transporter Mla subunit MlaD